jgi:hypothetical protein
MVWLVELATDAVVPAAHLAAQFGAANRLSGLVIQAFKRLEQKYTTAAKLGASPQDTAASERARLLLTDLAWPRAGCSASWHDRLGNESGGKQAGHSGPWDAEIATDLSSEVIVNFSVPRNG